MDPGAPAAARTVAPDDDPAFLAGLDKREEQELLSTWEAALKRREEELRKREGGTP